MAERIIPFKVPGVFYNLKRKTGPETLVLLRMTLNGFPIVWSTGINVPPKYWSLKKQRLNLTRGREDFLEINAALNHIAEIAQSIVKEFNGDISPEKFKQELSYQTGRKERPGGAEASKMDLFQFVAFFIDQEKNKPDGADASWKKYQTIFNHLQDFAAENGRKSLNFEDINWTFHRQFLSFLYDDERDFSQNTAAKAFSVIKTFLRHSRRLGLHDNRIFEERGFSVRKAKTRLKVRFSLEELKKVAAYDFSYAPRLERVRDVFIVGCFCGLRFSDWFKVAEKHIVTDETGAQFLEILTQKDQDYLLIPILPELDRILKKYRNRLPGITSQKFGDYIKEVIKITLPESTFLRVESKKGRLESEVVPKWTAASSHAARRSFASNFYEIGVPAFVLMRITGQSSERTFFDYIDLDKKEVAQRFAREIAQKYRPGLPDPPEE